MANASLRSTRRGPDIQGWVVVGADGQKVGTVHELLEDSEGNGAHYLAVELDQTTLAQQAVPGGMDRITAGRYQSDPHRPGAQPLADVDPSVGESERNADFNVGARQHAEGPTGAVPRKDDRLGGSGRHEHPRVLIPLDAASLKEKDRQVVLTSLRQTDLYELPAYTPVSV